MGKVEEDPPWRQLTEHYLPWHGHVTCLTVAPQYRRLGLAQSLTKALERGCEDEGAWFVDLFVREGNKTAVDLYEGLGYVEFSSLLSSGPSMATNDSIETGTASSDESSIITATTQRGEKRAKMRST